MGGNSPQRALLGQLVPDEFVFASYSLLLLAQTRRAEIPPPAHNDAVPTKAHFQEGGDSSFPKVLRATHSLPAPSLCPAGFCPLCRRAGDAGGGHTMQIPRGLWPMRGTRHGVATCEPWGCWGWKAALELSVFSIYPEAADPHFPHGNAAPEAAGGRQIRPTQPPAHTPSLLLLME